MGRGSGDGAGDPKLIQCVEQFEYARFQVETGLGDHPEMTNPFRRKFVGGNSLTEMGEEQGSALSPWQTDCPAEEIGCHLVATFGGGEQDCLLIERLGVKQQA